MTWIDTHVHVSAYSADGQPRPALLQELLAVQEAAAHDLRFVISADGAEMSRIAQQPEAAFEVNRFIHELVSRAPHRLYGGCMVNPNYVDQALRTMDAAFGEWGFVQLGEILPYTMGHTLDCPPMRRLAALAADIGVPVQAHVSTSNARSHASSFGAEQLEDLMDLMERVPAARYVIAHAVGTPKADPPVIDGYLDQVGRRFGQWPDNLWIEIRDFDSPGVPSALQRVPHNRILAGTDWVTRVGPPFLPYGVIFGVTQARDNPYPPSIEAMLGFLKDAGADAQTVERIAFRNAAQLLTISV